MMVTWQGMPYTLSIAQSLLNPLHDFTYDVINEAIYISVHDFTFLAIHRRHVTIKNLRKAMIHIAQPYELFTSKYTRFNDGFDGSYDCMYSLLARVYMLDHWLRPSRIPRSMIMSMLVSNSKLLNVYFNTSHVKSIECNSTQNRVCETSDAKVFKNIDQQQDVDFKI